MAIVHPFLLQLLALMDTSQPFSTLMHGIFSIE